MATLCIFLGIIQQVHHLGMGREWTKSATKNGAERRTAAKM